MSLQWIEFPHSAAAYRYPGKKLMAAWDGLHAGDCEPLPSSTRIGKLAKQHKSFADWLANHGTANALSESLLDAWRAFHSGDFGTAIESGAPLGPLGATIANKACGVYSTYLERNSKRALALLEAAIARGEAATRDMPDYPNAHYMLAFVLGRYSQRISIVQALAEGHATRVRKELETTLALDPKHADAHIALGLFHAEVVGKVGGIVGRVTYGASKDAAAKHFAQARKLAPRSPIVLVENAYALHLLDSRGNANEIEKLRAAAAKLTPHDAMERLDIERAKRGE
jgi:tetratricopeptide (TPR) repeat protein